MERGAWGASMTFASTVSPSTTAVPGIQVFFFFNDTATTEIYTTVHTLSLHDALPTCRPRHGGPARQGHRPDSHRIRHGLCPVRRPADRKSTRLNSSHGLLSRMPS